MRPTFTRLACTAAAVAGALASMPGAAQTTIQAPAPPLPVVPVAPATQPLPANRWTPEQIREAFDRADTDGSGDLTRAEAQRLAILPRDFEDMDQNKDGVISRAEYEAAFGR